MNSRQRSHSTKVASWTWDSFTRGSGSELGLAHGIRGLKQPAFDARYSCYECILQGTIAQHEQRRYDS